MKQVIVIGGGASGMLAAIASARGGAKTTLLEAGEKPGRKLLLTGNGRCNLTNLNDEILSVYDSSDRVEAKKLLALLKRYQEVLLQGKSCRTVVPENAEEEQMARDLYLLTNKPVMYVCNVDEASAVKGNAYVDAVRAAVADEHAEILVIAAKTESEIAEIEEYEDRQMFLEEMGLEESGVVRLIQGAYRLLGLQTFFTAGADECRAWTIRVGDKAPKAAGVIHTDFERGFIRAEVIKYEDFVHYKTEAAVRAAGKMGVEGKDYVVQDGDIMHFLFNV